MIVICKGALPSLLQVQHDYFISAGCRIKLFRNDVVPSVDDTVSIYQEANFGGYVDQACTDWGGAVYDPGGFAVMTASNKVFNQTSVTVTNTIYGYYVTTSGNVLLYAERNPAGGQAMNAVGASYTVSPRFTYRSDPNPTALAALEAQAAAGHGVPHITEAKSPLSPLAAPAAPRPAGPARRIIKP